MIREDEELPGIFYPIVIKRGNQRLFKRIIRNIPVEPNKFYVSFIKNGDNIIPGSEVSIDRWGVHNSKFIEEDFDYIKKGYGVEKIIINHDPMSEIGKKPDFPSYDESILYNNFILPMFKEDYKINFASFGWDWKFMFSKGQAHFFNIKHFSNGASNTHFAETKIHAKLSLSYKDEASLKFEGFISTYIKEEDPYKALSNASLNVINRIDFYQDLFELGKEQGYFTLKDTKKDINLLRNWFEYHKDIAYKQKFLFENHFPNNFITNNYYSDKYKEIPNIIYT